MIKNYKKNQFSQKAKISRFVLTYFRITDIMHSKFGVKRGRADMLPDNLLINRPAPAEISSLAEKQFEDSQPLFAVVSDLNINSDYGSGAVYVSADKIVAVGGGSPIDAAKAMWVFYEYPEESFDNIIQPFSFPELRQKAHFCAISSTSGTATEVTAFSVITDYAKGIKYPLADFNITPDVAIVDPDLVASLPVKQVAYTGMDALTHAIEGYITKGHCTISDMFHLEAIKLISENLRGAVQNTPEGREGMALGQYIAGMGFSNVGLGIVHSMAHGLSALYDTPHGVACAILLPVGLEYNKDVAGERYRAVGKAMGVKGIDEMNDAEAADATIAAVKQLSADVGIPANLRGILKEEDIQFLAESAYADACRPGNPRDTSVEEIVALYKSQL